METIQVRFEEEEGVLRVTPLAPRLDADVALAFRDSVVPLAHGRALVIVSLARVSFVDSSGLAALVSVQKRLAPGGRLRLVDLAPPIAVLLARTHLDELFCAAEEAAAPEA
jgi:anti-sigma B factor antagonist